MRANLMIVGLLSDEQVKRLVDKSVIIDKKGSVKDNDFYDEENGAILDDSKPQEQIPYGKCLITSIWNFLRVQFFEIQILMVL